jgi:hypothetical protein
LISFNFSTKVLSLSLFLHFSSHGVVTTVTMAVASTTLKQPEGFDLYARFAVAGALGCSVTHGAFTPVDV